MQVAFGELGEAPLEALATLSGAVALPLLCSPAMQAGRPELVARDVADSLRKLADTGAPPAATPAGFMNEARARPAWTSGQARRLRVCVRAQRRLRWGTCAGRRCCRCRRRTRWQAARARKACACWRRRWRPGCAR